MFFSLQKKSLNLFSIPIIIFNSPLLNLFKKKKTNKIITHYPKKKKKTTKHINLITN